MECCLCSSTSINRYLHSMPVDVMRCDGCGLVFLPNTVKVDDTYSKDYFLEREDYFFKDGIIDASGVESPHVKDFRAGLDWIESYKKPPGRLLDIGCAMGTFLSLAKEKEWNCYGVEISEYAVSIAKDRFGLEVFNGELRKASYSDDFFDVVTMWDITEHLPDPLQELLEVRRVLKPGGLLLVNTPNEESFTRKMARFLYRISGGTIDSPVKRLYHRYHLYYFNATILSLLLEKAGLNVIAKRTKVIPITKGRGSPWAKAIVRGLSMIERAFHAEYELLYIAQKSS